MNSATYIAYPELRREAGVMTSDSVGQIWRFVRGDVPPRAFEQWICDRPELEETLGPDLFFDLISADYRSEDVVYQLKQELEEYARSITALACECITLADLAIVDMADPGSKIEHLDQICRRGEPQWWLSLANCSICHTSWLFAQEERQNDIFILRRLNGEQAERILSEGIWPDDFDRFETLLRIGRDAGHNVIFFDPIGDSSLEWTMRDLARERPGFLLSELCSLLNVDENTGRAIAERAVAQGAVIDLGG